MTVMITNTILLIILTGMCALSTYIMFKQHQRNSKRGKERLEEIIVNDARVLKKDVNRVDYYVKTNDSGVKKYTDKYTDFGEEIIIGFLVPVDDNGDRDPDLVTVYTRNLYTLEKSEMIVRIDENIQNRLEKFILNGNG